MANTYLVTGGAGFVGSNLSLKLKSNKENIRVIAFDNLKRRGSELNIERLKKGGVDFIHGDIRNSEDLEAVGRVDCILDCSAEPSVLAGYAGSPQYLLNTNLGGTINCLEAARRHGAVIIFLSTSRVYPIWAINSLNYIETETRFELSDIQDLRGASGGGISEEFSLDGTRSLYGATKLCSELIMREYLETYGLMGIINRCGVLTGPWQMGKVDQGFVVLWTASHIFEGTLNYIGYGGKGKQVRDILHVDDLYRLIEMQLDNIERLNGEVFNIGGGRGLSVSLKELTALCEMITGKHILIGGIAEKRAGDIKSYITDISKAKRLLGWEPSLRMETIVESIASWINEYQGMLKPILLA